MLKVTFLHGYLSRFLIHYIQEYKRNGGCSPKIVKAVLCSAHDLFFFFFPLITFREICEIFKNMFFYKAPLVTTFLGIINLVANGKFLTFLTFIISNISYIYWFIVSDSLCFIQLSEGIKNKKIEINNASNPGINK